MRPEIRRARSSGCWRSRPARHGSARRAGSPEISCSTPGDPVAAAAAVAPARDAAPNDLDLGPGRGVRARGRRGSGGRPGAAGAPRSGGRRHALARPARGPPARAGRRARDPRAAAARESGLDDRAQPRGVPARRSRPAARRRGALARARPGAGPRRSGDPRQLGLAAAQGGQAPRRGPRARSRLAVLPERAGDPGPPRRGVGRRPRPAHRRRAVLDRALALKPAPAVLQRIEAVRASLPRTR